MKKLNKKSKPTNKTYSFTDKNMGAVTTGFNKEDNFYLIESPCFTDSELDNLKKIIIDSSSSGLIGHGQNDTSNMTRRSNITWLNDDKYTWVYERLWEVALKANKKFQFKIKDFNDPIQLASYDFSNEGFYNWHIDFSPLSMQRKLSISMPLNDDSEYEGGSLDIRFSNKINSVPQYKGNVIIFPSFALHRVTPVTSGTRYSLVGWIGGPDFS